VIKQIEIEGFKSLEKVDLKLGKLNLFVGANASGKSTRKSQKNPTVPSSRRLMRTASSVKSSSKFISI